MFTLTVSRSEHCKTILSFVYFGGNFPLRAATTATNQLQNTSRKHQRFMIKIFLAAGYKPINWHSIYKYLFLQVDYRNCAKIQPLSYPYASCKNIWWEIKKIGAYVPSTKLCAILSLGVAVVDDFSFARSHGVGWYVYFLLYRLIDWRCAILIGDNLFNFHAILTQYLLFRYCLKIQGCNFPAVIAIWIINHSSSSYDLILPFCEMTLV